MGSKITATDLKPVDQVTTDALFVAAADDNLDEVVKLFRGSISSQNLMQYVKPQTSTTLLHHALINKAKNVANALIEAGADAYIASEFTTEVAGIETKKTVLHVLAEMGEYTLTKKILDKISKSTKSSLLLKTTAYKFEGQRPRQLSCCHIASAFGHQNLVELYIDHGLDVNHQNKKKDSAIHWACRYGHHKLVHYLIQKGSLVDVQNDKGSSPIHWSIRYGHTEVLRTLIQVGKANVHLQRKLGLMAPIVLAAALGNAEILEILLEGGADPNVQIRGGETALHYAASEGHVDAIKILLRYGAKIDHADEEGNTAIMDACREGNCDAVLTLADCGADLTVSNIESETVWDHALNQDNNDMLETLIECMQNDDFFVFGETRTKQPIQFPKGKTPLHIAASRGDCEKLHCLLKDVNPDLTDVEGNTYLHIAAKLNQAKVLEEFVNAGNANEQNDQGETMLHLACLFGSDESVIVLLDIANLSIVNSNGDTPLHLAAKSSTLDPATVDNMVNVIIKTYAWSLLDQFNAQGESPLHVAAKEGRPDIIRELHHLETKYENENGDTPLSIATKNPNQEVFEAVLEICRKVGKHFNLNQANKNKETVLHVAAVLGDTSRITTLVEMGASLSAQDANGNTPLHCIVNCATANSEKKHDMIIAFDCVISLAVRWWCNTNALLYPSFNPQLYSEYKYQSVMYLIEGILNSDMSSVVILAVKNGETDIVSNILNIPNVYKFDNGDFDISGTTPDTINSSRKARKPSHKISPMKEVKILADPSLSEEELIEADTNTQTSLVEYVVENLPTEQAATMLNITPLKEMVTDYWSTYQWLYVVLMFVHILYMALLSAYGIPLLTPNSLALTKTNISGSNTSSVVQQSPSAYPSVFFLVWPMLVFCFEIYVVVQNIRDYIKSPKEKTDHNSSSGQVYSIIGTLGSYLITICFCGSIIGWFITYLIQSEAQDYILSIGLLIGWLFTITFLKGFETVNQFTLMLRSMLIRDMVRFFTVYFFILLAFSFAFQAMIQIAPQTSQDLSSPVSTMFTVFNMMLGMGDILTDTLEDDYAAVGRTTVFLKVLYILYVILGNIVLLNLVIAMMNDSYTYIQETQVANWRVGSVQLALSIQNLVPFTATLMNKIRSKKYKIFFNVHKQRWFVSLGGSVSKKDDSDQTRVNQQFRRINDRLQNLEQYNTALNKKLDILIENMAKQKTDDVHTPRVPKMSHSVSLLQNLKKFKFGKKD